MCYHIGRYNKNPRGYSVNLYIGLGSGVVRYIQIVNTLSCRRAAGGGALLQTPSVPKDGATVFCTRQASSCF